MNHDHGPGFHKECLACREGMAALHEQQAGHMAEYGYYMHIVLGESFINVHTHGFLETWNHPEMQIVMGINPKITQDLLWCFADRIKGGEKFEAGQLVDEIVKSFPVKLIDATEGGRSVLRVLLPDQNGKFPGDPGCELVWCDQDTVDTARS